MTLPAQALDLARWKLTLPTGRSERPDEVKQPQLATFEHPEFFTVESGGGVRFRAPVNGTTTSGSGYPRCELREMSPDGSLASWSSNSGAHMLTVVEAFTRLPTGKPHVVGAQIHDADDDVTVFRLEDTKLWVTKGDDTHHALADANYVLGTPFEASFTVWKDAVSAFYNGRLVTTIPGKFSKAYFKVGCYTQANQTNARPADASNYGEVVVTSVSVAHTTVLTPPVPPVEPPPSGPVTDAELWFWMKKWAAGRGLS